METTPLLQRNNEPPSPSSPALPLSEQEDYPPEASKTFKGLKSLFWKETVKLWKIAGPIALSLICHMNINGIELMLFVGINAAISVRVSNELGMGHPRGAKYSVYVTVFQSLVIGLVCMAVVLIAKDYFAYLFTSSEVMRVATSKLAFILGITMVLNSVQPVISGN
ncbi:unnamed protein product [Dovyalis caffra]|uniref:Uncharacterized protein n=1 Tax=Dovyalis caffra TaxID=77055 RepID=A0AAV1RL09_9ROSI|nr:unnamed protein product [Dovyalis caffra]